MPFSPLFMKDVLFTAGEGTPADFAAELSSVLFEPESETVTWKGLKPASAFTESTPPTWAATLKYAQDWDSETSFSRWLWDNQGTTAPVTFQPKSGVGPSFTANLTIISGPLGGDVDTYAESEVTLGSDTPVLVEPVA